ncbi:TRAP transporter small permease [Stappia sp. ES.058]|uniref:TRAP transporter small permease n=1 Tax=Stappia sp. ES.058 TaxID=1881061 RepID=UPI00087AD67D|nr:TRAP transporter small permease subunit [Stappia sp. ES.058]SDU27349.1 TRAP-type C4-dicarboxylate transport system, small permease component [Stappia sp. ES.058]
MTALGRGLRRFLDGLYLLGGALAALSLVTILAIIMGQMVARWTGLTFPGATSYAGYAMAAASFFAFAHALNHGAHIRVSILLNALGTRRRWLEIWCFAIGTALAWFVARYAIKATYWSWKFNDLSQGQDATPLWIPQTAMAIGAVLLAIAMTDHFVRVLFLGNAGIKSDTAEQSHGE